MHTPYQRQRKFSSKKKLQPHTLLKSNLFNCYKNNDNRSPPSPPDGLSINIGATKSLVMMVRFSSSFSPFRFDFSCGVRGQR